jgi:hypothetical protein
MSGGNWIGLDDLLKARDPEIAGLLDKIPQKISQKIPEMLPILDYFILNNQASVIELERITKISRNSIDRTIKSLIEMNAIEFKERKDRNEKVFRVTSLKKLKQYSSELQAWQNYKKIIKNYFKTQKIIKDTKFTDTCNRVSKSIRRTIKRNKLVYKKMTPKLLSKKLNLDKKQQKKFSSVPYPTPVAINEMNTKGAMNIISKYREGLICDVCLKEKKISFLKQEDHEHVCNFGHATVL